MESWTSLFIVGVAVVALVVLVRPVQAHVAGGRAQRGADHLRPARPQHAADDDRVRAASASRSSPARARSSIPGVQTVRRLSLDLREAELAIDCVTHQGIPLGIRGVVIYKVGDDFASIANAARRFLDQQDQMDQRVHNVFAGHLRAIVGNMTVEEMIRDREKLTQLTRESSGTEMEKLGLIVDSLQIQEIEDPTGYIKNLGRPARRRRRSSQARIAQAAGRPRGHRARAGGRGPQGRGPPRPARSSRPASRPRSTRPRPAPSRPARCPTPRPARRSWSQETKVAELEAAARGAAPAGHRPQAGRRQGLRAGHAGQGRARRPHRRRRGPAPGGRAQGRRPTPSG